MATAGLNNSHSKDACKFGKSRANLNFLTFMVKSRQCKYDKYQIYVCHCILFLFFEHKVCSLPIGSMPTATGFARHYLFKQLIIN